MSGARTTNVCHLRGCVITVAMAAVAVGCGGDGANGGGGGNGGALTINFEPPDRSHISYVANLLARVDAGDWTLGEGLVETLKVFVGEEEISNVLLQPELLSYEGTGIVDMANDYLANGDDPQAQTEIARLLGFLVFSAEQLEEMAGLTTKSNATDNAQRVTKGAEEQNCKKFFKEDDLPDGISKCLEQESEIIGGDLYRVFFPADSLPSGGWTQAHVSLVQEAISASVPFYEDLGVMPPVDIILSVIHGGDAFGVAFPEQFYCPVALFASIQRLAAGPDADPDRFKQVVAHELAHCFQVATFPLVHGIPYRFTRWQEEGLAEYWSNEVYPFVDFEWRWRNPFREQELRNTLFDRSYENFIYFQYLGNVIGNEGILEVLSGMPTDPMSDRGAQEAALGSRAGMDEIFHEFTIAVSDMQVMDSGGHAVIPVQPLADTVEITAAASPVVNAARVPPFGASRVLVGVAEEQKQARLDLVPRNLTIDSSRPATESEATDLDSLFVETLGGVSRPWSRGFPSRLPDEECDTAWRMLVTTTAEPNGGFDLSVPEVEETDACCLHGTWLMDNQALAMADSNPPGIVATYTGELKAQYRADGIVTFLWSDFMRTFVDNESAGGPFTSTDMVEGGGSQFYSTSFNELLLYEGPEITVTVTEGGVSFPVPLDTGLGDLQTSQFYTCEGDTLVTTIRGDVDIGWSRQ